MSAVAESFLIGVAAGFVMGVVLGYAVCNQRITKELEKGEITREWVEKNTRTKDGYYTLGKDRTHLEWIPNPWLSERKG